MKTSIPAFALAVFSALAVASNMDELKQRAKMIAMAGGSAAGYAEISKGSVAVDEVKTRFAPYGENAVAAAAKWAHDAELRDAPPAFRRFLFFEYLTSGTNIIAAASNPDELLINRDSGVSNVFADPDIAAAARQQMSKGHTEPSYTNVNEQLLATFPMAPPPEKAAACIACHASKEVNRPYPAGSTILGYTFVLQPLTQAN